MNLTTFLSSFDNIATMPSEKVWVLVGQSYPLYFFSQCLVTRSKSLGEVCRIDVASYSQDELVTLFTMSFLGIFHTYWLGDCTILDRKLREFLFDYLEHYQGPHRIILFAAAPFKSGNKKCLIIDVDQKIDKDIYYCLQTGVEEDAQAGHFVDELYHRVKELSFDEAYLLAAYQRVLGRRAALFFSQWLDKIVMPDRSLFTLSQYFFTKNVSLFLDQWQLMKSHYADEFWLVFWSEQMWQAFWFVTLMRSGQQMDARRYAKRLPFSFTQRDWQRYSSKELAKAHNRLYSLDYAVKNGSSFDGLELFLFQFSHNTYAA